MVQAILEWKEDKISGGEAGMRNKTNIQDIHRLAVCSDLRRNILINLYEGEKSLGDLRDELKISSTTAIHALRELEKVGLTFQDANRKYALTNIGRIITLKLLDFSNAVEVLKKHERFWFEHDLSGIPEHMMERIGWLRDSEVIQINALDIIKTHSSYVSFIKTAKWVKGVSPIFSPDYPAVFQELIEKDISTHLILTKAVLEKLIEHVGLENLKNAIDNHRFEISVTDENLRAAFTVTDAFLSFGLFTNNGVYDIAHDLIGIGNSAVCWGSELFEYYRKKAKKYKI